ncbi:flocculation protein FLO11-like isoform X2 [Hibiscus syriacus]|uniref:Flocculation protein FLO11-like isoform X2 n=1 Tax=Hibiscus syriacus TaxID=106335 RepID=A0A6A2ZWT8_HIBSY|nr:flocculation protein FLO11-like isoform X2 [Hibiscus syriacus]
MMILQPLPSSAATVAVDKATSELLNTPDWTLNINICDSLNSNPRQRKDFVKAVKRRLQHKNFKVQLLALTLLEMMVKNCGDFVHYQIDEREVLRDMIKIVKKKADARVRNKILGLLESWQEEFGGRTGEHPQYYWAYQELKRSGVSFPEPSANAVPIIAPLAKRHPANGTPSSSSKRVEEETMATHIENLSLDSIKDAMDLLGDMLQAVNPRDHSAVKDEVIVDIVNQCHSNQKRLMQMLTNTGDEKLLARGLELNDGLQSLLAKHESICSGTIQVTTSVSSKPTEAIAVEISNEAKNSSPPSNIRQPAGVTFVTRNLIEEDEEDLAQLTRRCSRRESRSSQSTSAGTKDSLVLVNEPIVTTTSYEPSGSATDDLCKALALSSDSAPQETTTKEQELIDALTVTLSSSSSASPPHNPISPPPAIHQNMNHPVQVPHGPLPYDSYIVPWAQPQVQPQYQPQNHSNPLVLGQQTQYHPYTYPLPKWANTPGYFTGANMCDSFAMNASNGDAWGTPMLAEKPYIPPYRLFEDLNVLGNGGGRLKMKSHSSSSSTQSMVGERK